MMMGRRLGGLGRFWSDRRGAVSPLFVIMLVPLIGVLSMATEASSWFFTQRAMQNAADSAALAAATNGCDPTDACHTAQLTPSYVDEAKAVGSKFNFTDDGSTTTVAAANQVACPAPSTSTNCYQVTITKKVPLYLTRVVGFSGDTTIGSTVAQTLKATAIANPKGSGRTYCLLSLATTGNAISTSGASKANPVGCYMMSDASTSCTGNSNHPIAQYVDAVGTSDPNCVDPSATPPGKATGGVAPVADTAYRSLASQIPANTCTPIGVKGGYTKTTNWSTDQVLAANPADYCGDINITGTVHITTPATGSVMVIENGTLNIASGAKLITNAGSSLTIIFTGPTVTGLSPSHFPTGSGTLDISAPPKGSGTWSGIAIYQDPALPSGAGVDISNAGNSPTWNLSGLLYAPNSNITLKGDIKQSTNGLSCFSMVDYTFVLKGAVSIYPDSQKDCAAAGLTPPTGSIGAARQKLVL